MKFAKELEEDLVPEWRDKYLDYKQGKKKVKAVSRAVRNIQRSPRAPLPWKSPGSGRPSSVKRALEGPAADASIPNSPEHNVDRLNNANAGLTHPLSQPIHIPSPQEQQAGIEEDQDSNEITSAGGTRRARYGSIIGSPISRPISLNLGEPALDSNSDEELLRQSRLQNPSGSRPSEEAQEARQRGGSVPAEAPNAFEVGRTKSPSRARRFLGSRHVSDPDHRHGHGGPDHNNVPFRERISPKYRHMRYLNGKQAPDFRLNREDPLIKRMFSRHGTRPLTPNDVPLESWQEVNARQDEFWDYLDEELSKIETFYKAKEEEATSRLDTLKRQLHILRDHRQQEVQQKRAEAKDRQERKRKRTEDGDAEDEDSLSDLSSGHHIGKIRNIPHARDAVFHPIKSAKQVQFKGTPQVLDDATPPTKTLEQMRDYARKPELIDSSYEGAKRKLKRALQEFYRGLELLKSYALLNRTAFRKINKKYDKAIHPTKTMAYYEKVNEAWFVRSGLIDEYIETVEDIYARYFYNANRKVAASKLRRKNRLPDAFTQSVFRNGLALGLGTVFAVEALVKASHLYHERTELDPPVVRTSYILQVYGSYFLLLFLTLLFCLDCRIFHHAKVNYVFIFEFDTRHNLDWRQLSEVPCLFYLLMGLFMWLNFTVVGGMTMYIWWPVILLGISLAVMFFPLPTIYHESRKWFLMSLGRLFMPFLPVEFRDFFLGDMLCSETYSFGGIELFFCLYANLYEDPHSCNSSSSRLLGFLTTVPGIIRLLQCFRRYWDTQQKFPHLVNAAKYGCTILQYMSLSLFRIHKTNELRAFFIACGTLNGLYTSTWDLAVDWSLLDPYAKHRFLRTRLAYKQVIWYYIAIIVDPLLRFNWVFYAIPFFTDEIQHSAILGFLVSFSEVCRRGMWTIFRVENEHCTNVGKFKASRDVELPYALSKAEQEEEDVAVEHDESARRPSHMNDYQRRQHHQDSTLPSRRRQSKDFTVSPTSMTEDASGTATGADVETGRKQKSPAQSSLRRRQAQQGITPSIPNSGQGLASRVGTILQGAHAQDFERKRRPSGRDLDDTAKTEAYQYHADDDEDSDAVATDQDANASQSEDDTGPRARARRALTGGSIQAKSSQEDQADKAFEDSTQQDISEAAHAVRRGRGEASSGESAGEESGEDVPNPVGKR